MGCSWGPQGSPGREGAAVPLLTTRRTRGGQFLLLFPILRAGLGWGVGMLAAKWHPGTFWGRRGQRQRAVLT